MKLKIGTQSAIPLFLMAITISGPLMVDYGYSFLERMHVIDTGMETMSHSPYTEIVPFLITRTASDNTEFHDGATAKVIHPSCSVAPDNTNCIP